MHEKKPPKNSQPATATPRGTGLKLAQFRGKTAELAALSRNTSVAPIKQHSPHIDIRPLMPTEIVRYVKFSYSYSWAANVTFIIDKTGCFNGNVCVLTARSRQVRNCPRTHYPTCRLPGVDARASASATDIWITRTPLSEPSPIHTGGSFHSNMRI